MKQAIIITLLLALLLPSAAKAERQTGRYYPTIHNLHYVTCLEEDCSVYLLLWSDKDGKGIGASLTDAIYSHDYGSDYIYLVDDRPTSIGFYRLYIAMRAAYFHNKDCFFSAIDSGCEILDASEFYN